MSPVIDVNAVLDTAFVPQTIEGTIDIDEFIVGDVAFAVQAPASYQVVLTALEDGVVAQGTVSLPVEAICARCLEPFDTALASAVDSMFYFEVTADEDGDPYPQVDEYGCIDLESEMIEDLIVAAPLAPLHDPTCKGLCFYCGTNLNTETCTCQAEAIDETHPFAHLDSLLKTSNNGEDGADGTERDG